jgi:hypothetical protein
VRTEQSEDVGDTSGSDDPMAELYAATDEVQGDA